MKREAQEIAFNRGCHGPDQEFILLVDSGKWDVALSFVIQVVKEDSTYKMVYAGSDRAI